MISLKELNPHNYPTTPEIAANLQELWKRLNRVRDAWGEPMTITSGLRSQADQQRINPKAPASKHLLGLAADVADGGDLKAWILKNVPLMEKIGLWFEDFSSTPTWVHFQIKPYGSWKPGKSIFFRP